jgi:hypothetical protein
VEKGRRGERMDGGGGFEADEQYNDVGARVVASEIRGPP